MTEYYPTYLWFEGSIGPGQRPTIGAVPKALFRPARLGGNRHNFQTDADAASFFILHSIKVGMVENLLRPIPLPCQFFFDLPGLDLAAVRRAVGYWLVVENISFQAEKFQARIEGVTTDKRYSGVAINL